MNAKQWWRGLEPRERRTLSIGAVALVIILFVFAIWLPAQRSAEAAEQRLAGQRAQLSWMQQAAAEARALQVHGGGERQDLGRQNLFSFVDKSAREAGLGSSIRQVEPTADQRVRIHLQRAGFDRVVSWLVTLKTRYGIEAEQFNVRRGEETGQVDAQIVLQGPPS